MPIAQDGLVRDLVFGPFGVPYASELCAAVLTEVAGGDVQCVRAEVPDGRTVFILNFLAAVDCLDEQRARFTRDGGGRINMMLDLRIDPARAAGHHALRVANWMDPLIVSERVLGELRRLGATGFVTTRVS